MSSKLIELQDGTLVQVDIFGEQVEQISGGTADKVSSALTRIKPILINACKPLNAAWHELNKDMNVEQAEVELGLSFETEGNLYITKSKANANLTIKLTFKPKSEAN